MVGQTTAGGLTAPRTRQDPPKGVKRGRRGGPDPTTPYLGVATPARICTICGSADDLVGPTSYWGEDHCRGCWPAVEKELDRTGWPRPWWMAPSAPHIAVLSPRGLWWEEHLYALALANVAAIGALAARLGVRQVWVHESALSSLGLPARLPKRNEAQLSHPLVEGHGAYETRGRAELTPYSRWRVPKGHAFSLHVPAWEQEGGGPSSPFRDLESPYRLLKEVAWYEDATEGRALWRGSAGVTSDNILRETYRSRRRKVELAVTERPEPIERGWAREARWYWARRPAPVEANYRYCHALDLNSAYMNVASSLPLPVGDTLHLHFPTFEKGKAGVWLIDPGPGAWVDPMLPAPWADDYRRDRAGPYWVTSPTMERCADLGLEAIEAYVWPEAHHYMRPWYELLREARAKVLDLRGPALEAIKDIPQRGVGRLASPVRTKDLTEDETFQPYWSWAIKAECRQRLHRRLAALEVSPVALDTDCAFFLSSRASPEILAVRLGLPLGDGLGQFTSEGTCAAGDARDLLERAENPRTAITGLRELVK